ncbi:hypothetical protein J1792_00240 [Streptomyces triculaminicus]|uniref:Uncharacterized protein n=2 Tax=Streptomyces TaxID=1883 RepID=A0A939FHF2_9ACTN|nr:MULTISPECIES: DUF6461 domain-containing protein [Streptomyces]MBO0651287.1 hypothetical protein [Streptomyces triculaminicus]QSY49614.1 hypothetical protein J3S04_00240 [Streptomyces griseocarneus]
MNDPDPLNLVERYGEGWCVTLAHRPLAEALDAMGVPAERQTEVDAPNGEGTDVDPPPLLAARSLPDGWTLVVETSGMTGWSGERDDVLEALTEEGGRALAVVVDPSVDVVLYAEDGEVVLRFVPSLAELEGSGAERFRDRLEKAGFFLDEDGSLPPELDDLPGGRLAVHGAELVWGRRLTADMFDGAAPWIGGEPITDTVPPAELAEND